MLLSRPLGGPIRNVAAISRGARQRLANLTREDHATIFKETLEHTAESGSQALLRALREGSGPRQRQ